MQENICGEKNPLAVTSSRPVFQGFSQALIRLLLLICAAVPLILGCTDSTEPDQPIVIPELDQIVDITASGITASRVTLTWTAPDGEGFSPDVDFVFRLKLAEYEITEENWGDESEHVYGTYPGVSGPSETDSTQIRYLKPDTQYWFAVRVYEYEHYSTSVVSVNCSFTTLHQGHLKLEGVAGGGGARLESMIGHFPDHVLCRYVGSYLYLPGSRLTALNVVSTANPFMEPEFRSYFPKVGGVCSDGDHFYFIEGQDFSHPYPVMLNIWGSPSDPEVQGACIIIETATELYLWEASLCVLGDRLFIGKEDLGVVDISNRIAPVLLGWNSDLPFPIREIGKIGSLIVTWDPADDLPLHFLDISNDMSPVVVGTLDPGGDYLDVLLLETQICVLYENGNLQVFNVANPAAPLSLGTVEVGTSVQSMASAGDILYTVSQEDGLEFYSLENPDMPVWLGSYDVADAPTKVATMGDLVIINDVEDDDSGNLLVLTGNR